MDLARVEDVQRPRPVEGQEICDVHKRVDRTQADGRELSLHPLRTRSVFHPAHQAQRESRSKMPIGWREIELHAGGTGKLAMHRDNRWRRQSAEFRRGQIARDAGNRHGIRSVRRQVDFDDRIVEGGPLHIGHADRRILRQFENAAVIF